MNKLLIVDDEPEIGELLAYNFRKRGFEVQVALNGSEGFNMVQQFNPEIIILDIMMPYVNGINLCRELKRDDRYKNVPVLFLSATNNETLIKSALDAGGDQFISKPIQLNLLINIVVEMKEKANQI